MSERVVSAVADLTGSDPVTLDPLYTVVDTDALDSLFEPAPTGEGRSPTRLEFTYSGCHVTVTGQGSVRVSDAS